MEDLSKLTIGHSDLKGEKLFTFFDFPPEIRREIYTLTLGPKNRQVHVIDQNGKYSLVTYPATGLQIQILRVNKTFQIEATPIFWEQLTATLYYDGKKKRMFFDAANLENVQQYRSSLATRQGENFEKSRIKLGVFQSVCISITRPCSILRKVGGGQLANSLIQDMTTAGLKALKYVRIYVSWIDSPEQKERAELLASATSFENLLTTVLSAELELPVVTGKENALYKESKGLWIESRILDFVSDDDKEK